MPKTKKLPSPRPYCWMVYDPNYKLYLKCSPNSRHIRWVSVPYAFVSDTHLMKALERIKSHKPDAAVLPYSLVPELATKVVDYGV